MEAAGGIRSMSVPALIACHECDVLNRSTRVPEGGKAYCWRCGAVLYRRTHDGLNRTLAFTLGAAAVMVIANLFPIVSLDVQGDRTSTTLFGAVRTLYDDEMRSVAALVFATTILMPALEVSAMLYILLPLKLGRVPRGFDTMFRLVHTVRPWGMVEVFMLGTLVSLAKLAHVAQVLPGIALWSFGALMFLMAAAAVSFDVQELWAQVEAYARRRVLKAVHNPEAAK